MNNEPASGNSQGDRDHRGSRPKQTDPGVEGEYRHADKVQAAIYRIAELAFSTHTLGELYASIHAIIKELMPANNFFIAFTDPADGLLHFPYIVDEAEASPAPIAPGKSLTGYVLSTGKPLLATPEVFEEMLRTEVVDLVGPPSVDWLGVPLRTQRGETIGVIVLQTYDDSIRLGEGDEDVLVFVSTQIAMVIEQKRVEQALREREQRYRSIFEYAPVGIFQSTLQSQFVYVNPELARLFRYESPEEFIAFVNGPATEADLYVEPEKHVVMINEATQSRDWKQHEVLFRRKDASVMLTNLTYRSAVDPNDGKTYLTGFVEDITARRKAEEDSRLNEQRLQALLQLNQMTDAPLKEITSFSVEAAVRLTRSKVGYLAFVNEEETLLTMHLWSDLAMKECEIEEKPILYRVEECGLWGEAVRQRKPIITNNYAADNPLKKGLPAGHVNIKSHANIPIFDGEHIVAVAGVGNKAEDYDESDLRHLTLLMQGMWRLLQRKRAEEAIRRHTEHSEAMVRVAARLNAQLNLDTLLKTVCEEAAHALSAPASWVSLYDAQREVLYCVKSHGLPPEFSTNYLPVPRTLHKELLEQNGAPRVVEDAQTWNETPNRAHFALIGIHTVAVSGMIRDGQLVGSINVASLGAARQFSDDELALLKGIGDQAAQAILNTRLFADIQRHLQYEQALHEIDLVITASNTDLRFTLNIILKQVIAQLKVDAAVIFLRHPYSYTFEYVAGSGFRTQTVYGINLHLNESDFNHGILGQRLIQSGDTEGPINELRRVARLGGEGFLSYYAIPLIIKGQMKGIFEVFQRTLFSPESDWMDFLEALGTQISVGIDNITLFENLQRSNAELSQAYDTTLEGWSRALDLRDRETEGHAKRVTEMTVKLAQALGVNESDMVHIRRGALLHDIGKMGVPDDILRKKGPLTAKEWEIMAKHPVYAYDLLSPVAFLRPALDIPYCHHEKWDGTGYPRGLRGEQIPRSARIFAILDVWDALLSDRPYNSVWAEDRVIEYIREQSGKHFDPDIVAVFLANLDSIRRI